MLFFGWWIVGTGGGFVTDKGIVDGLLQLTVLTGEQFDKRFIMVDDLPQASHLLLQYLDATAKDGDLTAVGVLHIGTTLPHQQLTFACEKVIKVEGIGESGADLHKKIVSKI